MLCTVGDYARAFDTDLVFEAGQNAIVFSADDLSWQARSADAGLIPELDVVRRTSALTRALLASGEANVMAVAAVLGLTPRTLQRQLAKQGTSFSRLLADLRLTHARDCLGRQALSATETAARLGFGDLSALSRFLRQNGAGSCRPLMKRG